MILVMTNDQNDEQKQSEPKQSAPKQDWSELAKDALDLWQNHLNAMASDPKIKEDMTRFVTPMTQMFSQWTEMMQNGMQGMAGFAASAAQPSTPDDGVRTAADTPEDSIPRETSAATDGAPADVRSEATDGTGASAGADSGSVSTDTPPLTPVVAAVAPTVQPVQQPVSKPAPAVEPPVRGRAASADGTRDLAQLAGRLAELERELDSLRPKSKRAADGESSADSALDGTVQRMARPD